MSPYHHTHSYYSRSYAVGYQCGICGRYARAQQRVPQCSVCLIPLCPNCNQSGFCAKHFAALSPADQAQAHATFLKTKRALRIFVIGMVVGFASFFIAILFAVTSPIHGGGLPPVLASIFVPLGIFMALVIGGSVYYQVTMKRGYQELQQIGQKYRTGQDHLPGSALFPPAYPQGTYIAPQPTYPSQVMFAPPPAPAPPQPPVPPSPPVDTSPDPQPAALPTKAAARYCPFCGCTLSSTAQFCTNCGSALK